MCNVYLVLERQGVILESRGKTLTLLEEKNVEPCVPCLFILAKKKKHYLKHKSWILSRTLEADVALRGFCALTVVHCIHSRV